ncbi:Major facilitator superfamily MFS_1 [Olavius algarvensis Delta 1 endosymbiont]|nr:Major facilitator superfamily MFS_1 [Olavius algarvensis Delta 1 endosymbiont]
MFFHRLCPAVIALDIQASFGLTGTLLGVLGSAYFYSYALMQLPTGLMADSWGPRKTVSSFFVLAGIGSIIMGLAPSLSVAVTGRILVGIGVSTVFVCNFKLLSEWFSVRQFMIMGAGFMVMGGIGALSSSAPLAWISNLIGWRMTLVGVGAVTLVMAGLVYGFVRNRPAEMGLAPIKANDEAQTAKVGLAAGLKMVVCSRRFWPIGIWAFCVIGISFAVGGLWGGPYLMHIYGLSKTAAGGVLSTFALALIFGSPLFGWLGNRYGRKPVLVGCSMSLMAVCGLLSWFVDSISLPVLYGLFFCFFITGGAIGPVIATVSKESFPIAISGTSVGMVNLFPFAGATFFQIVIGAVLTSQSRGQIPYTPTGYQYMFLICLAGAALSLAAAAAIKETLVPGSSEDFEYDR